MNDVALIPELKKPRHAQVGNEEVTIRFPRPDPLAGGAGYIAWRNIRPRSAERWWGLPSTEPGYPLPVSGWVLWDEVVLRPAYGFLGQDAVGPGSANVRMLSGFVMAPPGSGRVRRKTRRPQLTARRQLKIDYTTEVALNAKIR